MWVNVDQVIVASLVIQVSAVKEEQAIVPDDDPGAPIWKSRDFYKISESCVWFGKN